MGKRPPGSYRGGKDKSFPTATYWLWTTAVALHTIHIGKREIFGSNISPRNLHAPAGNAHVDFAAAPRRHGRTSARNRIRHIHRHALRRSERVDHEVEGYIRHTLTKYPDLITIVTGGRGNRPFCERSGNNIRQAPCVLRDCAKYLSTKCPTQFKQNKRPQHSTNNEQKNKNIGNCNCCGNIAHILTGKRPKR